MVANSSSQILWSQFTQAIAAKMGAGASEAAIQVLPAAHLLYGETATDIATSINEFVEIIPQWGSIYNPSDRTVIDAYQNVLTQMKPTATNYQSIKAQYEATNQQLQEMMGKASTFKLRQIKAYVKAKSIYTQAGLTPPSFPDWFKNNGQQEYQTLLAAQVQQAARVQALLDAEGISSPLTGALDRLNTELKDAASHIAVPVTINPSADLLAGWKKKPTNPGAITFDNKSTHYDYSKTIWQSQTGVKLFGFISIGHRDKTHTQDNILSTSTSYSLDIEFAAQTSINITQGDWFDGSLLTEYKSGPWVEGSQFASGTSHPYGQDGIFPLLVTKLYVVMNPKITITLDKTEFQSFYDQLSSNFANGVSLGPLAFGGKNNHNTTICKTHSIKNQQTVTLQDFSNLPQIVAVVNELMS